MPVSDRSPASAILAHWPRIVLAALSVAVAWYVWSRPVSPKWTRPIAGRVPILGISRAGQLITLDQPALSGPAKLQVRDVSTGAIQREFDLAAARYGSSQVTPDGHWAVIEIDSKVQVMVVSLETGQLRFPPRYCEGVSSISPDSHYAIIRLGNFKLMNLATGESQAAFDQGYFSVDSRLLTMQRASQQVAILNLKDMKEQSLGEVSLHSIRPESQDPYIMGWEDDRVYVCYSLKPGGQERKRSSEVWSFDTRGESLSDPRLEPELTGRWVTWRNGHRGVLRGRNRWAATFYRQFLNLLEAIKIRVKSVQTLVSWQPLDPEIGGPRGAMIEDLDFGFRVSPDGRWLVDGYDQQLRCWQLPAQRGPRRWLETLLAGLLPWALVFLIGRLKRSNRTGSQAVAGRFPLNEVSPLG